MRKLSFLAVLLSASSLFSIGCSAHAAAKGDGRSIVWKVEGKTNTVYLAGSVHLLREQDFPIPPTYDEAYVNSGKIIFEIDTKDMLDPGVASQMQKLGSYHDGDTLAEHVSADTIEQLDKFLAERQLPRAVFMKMKPGLLSMVLSSLEAGNYGARPDLGLETIFGARAAEDGKPTSGLETIEFQIGLFDQFNDAESEQLLRSTLDSLDDIESNFNKLVQAWRNGDTAKLDRVLNREFDDGGKLREVLLIQRNRNWIPHIEKALASGHDVMFMVGAGHLVGTDGVIDLLKGRGHKPTQMLYDRAATKARRAAEEKSGTKPKQASPTPAKAEKAA